MLSAGDFHDLVILRHIFNDNNHNDIYRQHFQHDNNHKNNLDSAQYYSRFHNRGYHLRFINGALVGFTWCSAVRRHHDHSS